MVRERKEPPAQARQRVTLTAAGRVGLLRIIAFRHRGLKQLFQPRVRLAESVLESDLPAFGAAFEDERGGGGEAQKLGFVLKHFAHEVEARLLPAVGGDGGGEAAAAQGLFFDARAPRPVERTVNLSP